jgi:hypothetical protein
VAERSEARATRGRAGMPWAPRTTFLVESKGERAQRLPDDASTAGSEATEERSESRSPERARASEMSLSSQSDP